MFHAQSDYVDALIDRIQRGRALVALQEDIVARMKGWDSEACAPEQNLAAFRWSVALLQDHLRDIISRSGRGPPDVPANRSK